MDHNRKAAIIRLRTQSKSRLTKVNLVRMLSKPEAWSDLPPAARQRLYSLLPPPYKGEAPHQIDQHPFRRQCGQHLERACTKWQQELAAGFHTKLHRSHKADTTWEDLLDTQVREDNQPVEEGSSKKEET